MYTINRTLFPVHWSKEELSEKLREAYEDFKKKKCAPKLNHKGQYLLRGSTHEGIEIEMLFNRDGDIKAAYPISD